MFDKKEFKKLLKKAIGNNTITNFSKISGVNRTYLSKYLNEKLDSAPSPEILKDIANSTNEVTYHKLMDAAGYLDVSFVAEEKATYSTDNSADKIKSMLSDDPELFSFWDKLKDREDLRILFKQTKDMTPEGVRQIIRIIKAIEDEEEKRYNS